MAQPTETSGAASEATPAEGELNEASPPDTCR